MLRKYKSQPFSRWNIFNNRRALQIARDTVTAYSVKTSGALGVKSAVRLLSGGNQQKLIIAREISEDARFIVASQPTRGLDVGATAFVREKLLEQKRQGNGVMLISADLEEILAISDRIAVMEGGRITGILDRSEASIDTLGLLMGGIDQEAVK